MKLLHTSICVTVVVSSLITVNAYYHIVVGVVYILSCDTCFGVNGLVVGIRLNILLTLASKALQPF